MKRINLVCFLALFILILSACGQTVATPTTVETSPPESTKVPEVATPTEAPPPTEPPPPQPTPFTTDGWSTTAATKTELSFAFPGNWDGSSPLTFGEGEFVKDPELPLGVTFQIDLQGSPDALLDAWGSTKVGVVGITTFTPETVTDGPEVTIARVTCPTKIASGEGVTGQVAYIQRAEDVMEIMWFAPTDQWESMQETFEGVLDNIELWRKYVDGIVSVQSLYVHDWQAPTPAWDENGVWFKSADGKTGLVVFAINEIADPVEVLNTWSTERLTGLGLSECTLVEGDRMNTMSGQWESKTGECADADGKKVTYEVSFIPNKDRLLEMIAYAPSETWEDANKIGIGGLLRLMIDMRP